MAKLLKLRISKAVSSSFNSCRSKDPSTLPQHPVPSFLPNTQLITLDHFLSEKMIHRNNESQVISIHDDHFPIIITPHPPISKPHHTSSTFKCHVSDGRCSSGNGQAPYSTSDDSHTRSPSHEFKWKKEEDKWQHVVKTTYDDVEQRFVMMMSTKSSSSNDESGINFISEKANWDNNDIDITSKDEEDEIEILVSSSFKSYLEFFDDSSSNFSQKLKTIDKTTITRRPKKIATTKRRVKNTRGIINKNDRRSSISTSMTSSDSELSARLSELIPCNVEGKVKESFAIFKKSEDPYEDFKSSMMEMILEEKMFDKNDLEQLLHCFLSLNAKNYHGVIIEAFSEIWNTLFSPNHN